MPLLDVHIANNADMLQKGRLDASLNTPRRGRYSADYSIVHMKNPYDGCHWLRSGVPRDGSWKISSSTLNEQVHESLRWNKNQFAWALLPKEHSSHNVNLRINLCVVLIYYMEMKSDGIFESRLLEPNEIYTKCQLWCRPDHLYSIQVKRPRRLSPSFTLPPISCGARLSNENDQRSRKMLQSIPFLSRKWDDVEVTCYTE